MNDAISLKIELLTKEGPAWYANLILTPEVRSVEWHGYQGAVIADPVHMVRVTRVADEDGTGA